MKKFLLLFLILAVMQLHSQSQVFTIYDQSNTPQFTTNFFRGIAIGKYGHVWVGSQNQGLYRFNGSKWEKATLLQTHAIRGLAMGPDSTIWVAQSGTGSSGGSTNANGGVSHFTDTTYTATGWGYLTGLPTRAVYGIAVSGSGNVYTSHFTQTTSALPNNQIRGGGLGYKESSATNFSAIYEGMPYNGQLYNGTINVPYWDQSTLGIGTNGQEVWIGLNRACDNGNCLKPAIAKYGMAGNFLGIVSPSNLTFPFTNATDTPIPRAIFFDALGRAWVGLSKGGIYVYDQGSWYGINESNSLFPSVGGVNFHSIAQDASGRMLFGTDAGLLILRSFDYTDTSSYSLYTVSNGLPGSSILGIAPADDAVWLATNAGVVKMEEIKLNAISGTVYNSTLNIVAQKIAYTIFAGCKAVLVENGIRTDSTATDALGNFVFKFLDPSKSYNVEVSTNYNIKIKCFINNTKLDAPYTVKLPYDLYGQLLSELDPLGKQEFKKTWFPDWSNLNGTFTTDAYITTSFTQLADKWIEFDLKDNSRINDGFARMIIISMGLDRISDHGASMISMTTSSLTDVGKTIFVSSAIYNNMQARLKKYGSGLTFLKPLTALVDGLNTRIYLASKIYLGKALYKIPDLQLRISIRGTLISAIDALHNKALEPGSLGSGAPQITYAVENSLKSYLAVPAFKYAFVPLTQSNIENAASKLSSFSFSQPINTTIAQTVGPYGSKLYNADLMYKLDSTTINVLESGSTYSEYAETFFQSAVLLSGISGVGAPLIPVFVALSKAAKSLSYALKAGAIVTEAHGIYSSYNSTFEFTSTAIRKPVSSPLKYKPQIQYNSVAISDYLSKLAEIKANVLNGEKSQVANKLSELQAFEDVVTADMTQLADVVFAYSEGPLANDSVWNNFVNNRYIETNAVNLSKKDALNFEFISYLLDENNEFGSISLLSTIDDLTQHSQMLNLLTDSIVMAAHDWIIPDKLSIYASYPFTIGLGQNIPFSVTVKNMSASDAKDVYIRFISENGLIFSADSISVGTILAGAMKTIPVLCQSPAMDTLSSFTVQAYSTNIPGDGTGGAILINNEVNVSVPEAKLHTDNFLIYPNPNQGHFTVSTLRKDYVLELYNAMGELIYTSNLKGAYEHTIHLGQVAKGVYTVRLFNATNTQSQHIVIQ